MSATHTVEIFGETQQGSPSPVPAVPAWRRRYAATPCVARLADARRILEDVMAGGSVASHLVMDHLSWALAHINECGVEIETGEGRSPRWMQDDRYDQEMRAGRVREQLHRSMAEKGGAE